MVDSHVRLPPNWGPATALGERNWSSLCGRRFRQAVSPARGPIANRPQDAILPHTASFLSDMDTQQRADRFLWSRLRLAAGKTGSASARTNHRALPPC